VNAASLNPFDPRTALFARHAQHVVLIHFPIALYLAGVALDLSASWLKRKDLAEAAYLNLTLAAFAALPAAATGLLAWQWQLEGQKLKGVLLEHLIAGGGAAVAVCWTWFLHYRSRRAGSGLPPARFLLEGLGAMAVMAAGHLGGFLSGVNVLN
jgi:uncharacterized membrane protein